MAGCGRPNNSRGLCGTHRLRADKGQPLDTPIRVSWKGVACAIPDCERVGHLTRGWCDKHYQSWTKHGDPLASSAPKPVKSCSVEGCPRPFYGNRLCQLHYSRVRATGTTDAPARLTPEQKLVRRRAEADRRRARSIALGRTCSVDDCAKVPEVKGLCVAHHARLRKYGDPLAVAPMKQLSVEPFSYRSPSTCTIDDCGEVVCYVGLCERHYNALRKHGDALKVKLPRRRTTPLPHSASTDERFWVKIDRDGPVPAQRPELGPCWMWLGGLSQDGYGIFQMTRERRRQGAHRYAWQSSGRELIPGLTLDHLCFVRACVRPDHCEQVPLRVNQARSRSVCVLNSEKRECRDGHPFDKANTIRRGRYRQCRTCYNTWRRRRRATVRLSRADAAIAREYRKAIASDRCRYCDSPGDHVDHYFPVAKGGGGRWNNLAPACSTCNRDKRTTCGTAFVLRKQPELIGRVFPRA